MKIIYSTGASLGGGGIGNTANYAAREIYKAGILDRIICLENKQCFIPENKIFSFKWTKYLLRYPIRAIQKFIFKNFNSYYFTDSIYDLFARKKVKKCDIFHYWKNHGEFSAKKAKKLGAKIIVENASLHPLPHKNVFEEEYQKYGIKSLFDEKKYLEKSFREINNADYVVVPRGKAYESFLENNYPKEKLIPVQFGFDFSKIKENPKKNFSKNKKFIALYVGNVSLEKGVHYLLEAWQDLRLKNSELIIVGPILREFLPFVKKYKMNKSIIFTGFSKPDEYYKEADIFVFPSLAEGSALVTYEAMAYGVPQISTENSGSVARNNREGFIIPIKNSKILREKIKYLYENPKIREKMSKNCLIQIKKYPWENYGKELIKAYKKILNQKRIQ